MQLPSALFSPRWKIKDNTPQKAILIIQKVEILDSNIKKFQETDIPKKFDIFQEKKSTNKYMGSYIINTPVDCTQSLSLYQQIG